MQHNYNRYLHFYDRSAEQQLNKSLCERVCVCVCVCVCERKYSFGDILKGENQIIYIYFLNFFSQSKVRVSL